MIVRKAVKAATSWDDLGDSTKLRNASLPFHHDQCGSLESYQLFTLISNQFSILANQAQLLTLKQAEAILLNTGYATPLIELGGSTCITPPSCLSVILQKTTNLLLIMTLFSSHQITDHFIPWTTSERWVPSNGAFSKGVNSLIILGPTGMDNARELPSHGAMQCISIRMGTVLLKLAAEFEPETHLKHNIAIDDQKLFKNVPELLAKACSFGSRMAILEAGDCVFVLHFAFTLLY